MNNDPVLAHYCFLSGSEAFEVYQPDRHDALITRAGAIILLDAALPERTGHLAVVLRRARGVTVVNDHHPGGGWAQVEMIDPARSATVEFVYDILNGLPMGPTPSMAEALYTGLVADTLGFRGANTTAPAHALAAWLIQAGAPLERVHDALFRSWERDRLRLLGRFLSTLRTAVSGLVVWGPLHKLTCAAIAGPQRISKGSWSRR